MTSWIERIAGVLRGRQSATDSSLEGPYSIRTFDLARTLQQSGVEDLADWARLLGAVGDMTARGIVPSSQMLQEAFALAWSSQDRQSFVECGAAGPRYLSNTHVLQESYGWSGLLIEPNPDFVRALAVRVSPAVAIEPLAVGRPGTIELVVAGELSSSVDVMASDGHAPERLAARAAGRSVLVERVPLEDVLRRHFEAVDSIGFLSVDVEGGELEALDSLDWGRWTFNAIAVEHNNVRDTVEKLDAQMAERGYRRVLPNATDWDAWFVPMDATR